MIETEHRAGHRDVTPPLRREVLCPRPPLRDPRDVAAGLSAQAQRAAVCGAVWFTAWLVALLTVLSHLLGGSS